MVTTKTKINLSSLSSGDFWDGVSLKRVIYKVSYSKEEQESIHYIYI